MGDLLSARTLAGGFEGVAQQVHGAPLAYLDNAATTHMPRTVRDAMAAFEQESRANIHRGVHTLSQRATDAFEQARARLKRFIGAGAQHELVFTSGTTESLNLVAGGLSDAALALPVLRAGDEIVTTALEHHANLVPWQWAARRSGARLLVLRPDAAGRLHPDDLAQLLGPRTRVFALTACANATGERPPYEALLALAAEAGALTVLDAAQAMAHEVPQLAQLECDFLAFSGHKMYGPMGIGVLAGRRAALERLAPSRLGGDMVEWVSESDAGLAELPARLEGGTPNVAGAVGLAAAADYIDVVGRDAIDAHVRALRAHAVQRLAALPGVTVLAPHANASAIVSFVADGAHPHDIGTLLDAHGIAVRTGHHCAQPLLACLGVGPTTRASFAIYNTHEEVERLAEAVAHALEVLR
ncbi:aminotransferase class V-fold PLP-dependent enzyme [Ramlibacter alkalitolerans]|uniref:cysteine desulfurase n=1 Tax=Ramlibacter alkalitolerans TaxID=2039631 RepID=A0ABS1JLS4_9BURK|nr:aminotransferase class V-fold PLP-dependent enzyme [Ramlibacter alkalitolerans]MBL0425192.1 aminotransferase class V-fold PLP-dependent enzyme [Ramlibacter alkalitolerans]